MAGKRTHHTAGLLGVNAFDYLVALQRHNDDVSDNPERWMPWNFSETMAALQPGPPPEP